MVLTTNCFLISFSLVRLSFKTPLLSNIITFSFLTPRDMYNWAQLTAAAPAPFTTTFNLLMGFLMISSALSKPAEVARIETVVVNWFQKRCYNELIQQYENWEDACTKELMRTDPNAVVRLSYEAHNDVCIMWCRYKDEGYIRRFRCQI